jgi:hypothetical protein
MHIAWGVVCNKHLFHFSFYFRLVFQNLLYRLLLHIAV